MKRHGRHLEREAHEQQTQREHLHRRGRNRLRRNQAADAVEPRAPRQPVRERDAVQEERARKRAEQKILEGGLGGDRRIAANARQDVHGNREHFEGEENHEQVGRGRHEHHAGEGKQQQRVVLAARQPLALDGRRRKRQRQQADDDQHAGDEQPEVVGHDDAEARRVVIPERDARQGGPDEADDAERRNRHPLAGHAEGLRDHRGNGGSGHAGHRHDRVKGCDHRVPRGSWLVARA